MMMSLPARMREIYRLSRDASLTAPEIAGVLGVSVNTVYEQLSRALRALSGTVGDWSK